MLIVKILISVLGLSGFLLASYIRHCKTKLVPLVCPVEGSCEKVVHSDYSKLFGIPLEVIGMFYYAIISLSYALFAIFPTLLPDIVSFVVMGLTAGAFFFSLYLTFVQAFFLRHWCTWCLISASICSVIFALVMISSRIAPQELARSIIHLF